jgi:ketosteroid isomerase-like protein
MSQENAELVRRLFWAFDHDADAWKGMLAPELEWFPFENNHTPSYGIAAAMRTRAEWRDAWEDARSEAEHLVGKGENVVATVRLTGRGKTSGANVDVRIHFHFKVREGKVVYAYEYGDKGAALEAAGLSDEAISRETP